MWSALRRLRAFFHRNRLDDEVGAEIRLHLDLRRQALIDEGMSPADADREARRQFGNVALIRERTRDEWGGSSFDVLVQDVRYGLRMIRKSPGFSAIAIASLAVGIGTSTVLFSVASAFVLRPVQAADPEQLIQLFTSNSRGGLYGGSSYADYETFRDVPVFDGLLAWTQATATLSHLERPDVVGGLVVSGNYFEVLGLLPAVGRFFRPEENRIGSQPVVVLSHDAWRRRFGSDPGVAGRVIELNGHPFTVIGVGPKGFTGTSIEYGSDFFVPAAMQPLISPGSDALRNREARTFYVLGRLRPNLPLREADAALRVTAAQLLQEDPTAWRDRSGHARVITVLPETKARFATAGPGYEMFLFSSVFGGIVALLAIACVNVATVLLARATTRRKEIAVRLAMGASRRRIVRQLLTECALLAAAGGALGVAMAQWAAALAISFRPAELPAYDLSLDYRILLFSVAASLLTIVLFGLAPALQTSRPDLNAELKGGGHAVRIRGLRFGLRAGLVVVQVAVSLALLIGGALMIRSANAGLTEDPGFRRDGVLNIEIDLSTVPDRAGSRARFYQEAVRSVAALPGVERVVLAALIPMSGTNSHATVRITDGSSSFTTSPDINIVGPGYFGLLDIPLMQGREFTAADRVQSPLVAVVNQTMAERFWKGEAVGETFVDENTRQQFQIIGVSRDLRHRSFSEVPMPMVYFSAEQRAARRLTLHVRTAVPPHVIGPAIHELLHGLDRVAGLAPVETMTQYFERITQPQRLSAAGAMAVALVELALVVMALYGVIAFAASQRRREIGLRVALGASSRSVMTLIMRDGLLLTAAGVVLGVGIALIGGAALGSMLIGVGPADPVSFGGAALLLIIVGALASYLPARRALRVDPSTALRSE
jgi:predicted permease